MAYHSLAEDSQVISANIVEKAGCVTLLQGARQAASRAQEAFSKVKDMPADMTRNLQSFWGHFSAIIKVAGEDVVDAAWDHVGRLCEE
eukprot:8186044-Pyramimonas_sp.AAC.1